MPNYKVEYIPTSPDNKKWYKQKNRVDGWTLGKEIEALLFEYGEKGYRLVSTEAIITSELNTGYAKTDGVLVILEKEQ